MNAQQAYRSIRLATEILPKIPRKKYDIGDYSHHDDKCGTVCCIAGWAAVDDEFVKEGCRFDPVGDMSPWFPADQDSMATNRGGTGAAYYFGLPESLFYPAGQPGNESGTFPNETPTQARKSVEFLIHEAGFGDYLDAAKARIKLRELKKASKKK